MALALSSACATAPAYRPLAPPLPADRVFEAGVAAHGVVGDDRAGPGVGVWAVAEVVPDVEVVARAHGTDLIPYRGGGLFDDVLWGGGAGLRWRSRFFDTFHFGAEGFIDYQERRGPLTSRSVSFIAGIPVAELAFDDFWVYAHVNLGIAIPIYLNEAERAAGLNIPFFGISEIPLGVAWELDDWLVLVAEGGYALPFNGGYLGVGAAFRL